MFEPSSGFSFGVFVYGMVVVVPIVAIHLFLSSLLWWRLPRRVSLLTMAMLSIVTTVVWWVAGLLLLFYFAILCSHCFSPESGERNTYVLTAGLPLDGLRFVLVAASLYVLGILFSVAFTTFRRRRRKISGLVAEHSSHQHNE